MPFPGCFLKWGLAHQSVQHDYNEDKSGIKVVYNPFTMW